MTGLQDQPAKNAGPYSGTKATKVQQPMNARFRDQKDLIAIKKLRLQFEFLHLINVSKNSLEPDMS
jgi:hypothetical protein